MTFFGLRLDFSIEPKKLKYFFGMKRKQHTPWEIEVKLTHIHKLAMAYIKYSPAQLAERERAKVAIAAAKAQLKAMRDAKKAKKDRVVVLRRQIKAEIKRRKEAATAAKKADKELKALKTKCRTVLAVLRRVYKPYLVARRKVARLQKAKAKAALLEDRKAAKAAALVAKEQLKSLEAKRYLARAHAHVAWKQARAEARTAEGPQSPKASPKKALKMRKRPTEIKTKDIEIAILPAPIAA